MGVGLRQFRDLQESRTSQQRGSYQNVEMVVLYYGYILQQQVQYLQFVTIQQTQNIIMRKTVLYWQKDEIKFLQKEQERLKALSATYSELILSPKTPQSFNPRYDFIRLTNSDGFPVDHRNLLTTVVYCLKLSERKRQQIEQRFKYEHLTVSITNSFNNMVSQIIRILGYEGTKHLVVENCEEQDGQKHQNKQELQKRFVIDKQTNRPQEQMIVLRKIQRESHYISKLFNINIDVEKSPLKQIKQQLQKQLKKLMKEKNMLIMEKEFSRIRDAKSLQQLCRACLYFYSLEKYPLYKHLNIILKNIRSVTFQRQFQNIKLFAFLLILNYFFVYYHSNHDTPDVLYRFTDTQLDKEQLVGEIVTIPCFYSVSQIEIEEFKDKKNKLIIYPLAQTNNISVRSVFPMLQFSAYKKQKQYLYIPFTSFKVMAIKEKKGQTVVYLKQVPGNSFITSILNTNLNIVNSNSNSSKNKITLSEQELLFQLKYEYHPEDAVKMKVSYNLGVLHYKYSEKYELSKQYLLKCIQLCTKLNNNVMLAKTYNQLGLVQSKLNSHNNYKQAQNYYDKCRQILNRMKAKNDDKNIYRLGALLNNEGALLQSQNKYQQAMNKYKQAHTVLKQCKLNNKLMQACIMNNIGRCEMELDNSIQNVLKIYNQCIQMYTSIYNIHHIPQLIPIYENIAQLHQRHQHYKQSISYQKKAIQLYTQIKQVHQSQSYSYMFMKMRLAKLYNTIQQFDKSIQQYSQVVKISQLVNDNGRTSASIMSNIASAYLNKGGTENYKMSVHYYEKGIEYITKPLLNENLQLYNKICNMKSQLQQCIAIFQN